MLASMSSGARRLAALRFVAALLTGDRESLPPAGRAFSWDELLELADALAVAPPLWHAVRGRAEVPSFVAEGLHERYRANAIRNARLKRQLGEATVALNAAGVVPLLIKGALALVDGTLETIGDRWMEDLDLAVPREQLPAAEEALVAIGYRPNPGKPFWHPHEVPFFRARAAGPIELHVELGFGSLPAVLPVGEAWAESFPLSVGAASARALSPTHQVLHNVLHSAVQDFNHAIAGLPLRQLLALARLARAHGESVDWTAVRRRMDEHGLGRELREYLWLARQMAGMPMPPGEWGRPRRLHNTRIAASFALGWPVDVQRNLRYAFGRDYLDSIYNHGDRPALLALARCRHALAVLRRDGRGAVAHARTRRA